MKRSSVHYKILKHIHDNTQNKSVEDITMFVKSLQESFSDIQVVINDINRENLAVISNQFDKKKIKAYITIKGIQFVMDYEKFKNDHWLSKAQRIFFYPAIIIGILIPFLANKCESQTSKKSECIIYVESHKETIQSKCKHQKDSTGPTSFQRLGSQNDDTTKI